MPLFTYLTALFIIFNLFIWAYDGYSTFYPWSSVSFSILFFDHWQFGSDLNILSTNTAGTCISSGSIYPGYTISSTSAMTHLAAVAISALKFLAVLLKYRLPRVSAFKALTNAYYPNIVYS